jgi:hypothetical protein
VYEYKPPSVPAQYKLLAVAFVLVVVGVTVYFIKLPRTPLVIPPPPLTIYVEPVSAEP